MNDAERIEINNIAVSIMEDSLYPKELFEVAKRIYDLTKDPRPDWTPCAAGLPEDGFGCLVTIETDDYFGDTYTDLLGCFVGYNKETKSWINADGKAIPFEVIAWQPLPAPYRADQKEDNRTCAVCVGKTIDYQSSFYECALSGANELADRCSTCENNGSPTCGSCIMTGHGNDIDFYKAATEPKGGLDGK